MNRLFLFVVTFCSFIFSSCTSNPNQGVFVEVSIPFLSISMDSSGSVTFEVGPEFEIPILFGSVKVGIYQDISKEFNLPSALVIRVNGEDRIYNLNGQDFEIRFSSNYYKQVRLIKQGNNIILELEPASNISISEQNNTSQHTQTLILQGFSCEAAYGPSFQIGDRFYVPFGDGPTSVWEEPNNVPKIGRILEGDGGVIIGGPVCKRGQEGKLVTWMIRSDSGLEGWVSEGYPHSPVPWIAPIE